VRARVRVSCLLHSYQELSPCYLVLLCVAGISEVADAAAAVAHGQELCPLLSCLCVNG
jgi:hypothetical protein